MKLVPFNEKAGYDITNIFYDGKKNIEAAKARLEELNRQGPKGWRLIPLEG